MDIEKKTHLARESIYLVNMNTDTENIVKHLFNMSWVSVDAAKGENHPPDIPECGKSFRQTHFQTMVVTFFVL